MAKLADEFCHEVTSSKLLRVNGEEWTACQRGREKEEITDPLVTLGHENCSWEETGSDSGKVNGKWASGKIFWHKKLWSYTRILQHEDNMKIVENRSCIFLNVLLF